MNGMQKAVIEFQDGVFYLTGDVRFSNAMSLYSASLSQLNTCQELKFDFSKLTSSDSAGIALLMEWVKFAKKSGKAIRFHHLPHHLQSIIHAARLDQFFADG